MSHEIMCCLEWWFYLWPMILISSQSISEALVWSWKYWAGIYLACGGEQATPTRSMICWWHTRTGFRLQLQKHPPDKCSSPDFFLLSSKVLPLLLLDSEKPSFLTAPPMNHSFEAIQRHLDDNKSNLSTCHICADTANCILSLVNMY